MTMVEPRAADSTVIRKKTKMKKQSNKRVIRRTNQSLMALQRLFLWCQRLFKGPGTVPSAIDVHKLSHCLDGVMPEDVGLGRELQFFKPKSAVQGVPRVTYTTIYQCENFSLCILFLPASAVIPLHNHPGMTVFSKLLLGTIHIKSYDWVDPENLDDSLPPQLRLARMKTNRVFTGPCNTGVLYPTSGGNIHAFTAITPCAVLDVMGPPYSKQDGRDCSYYKDTTPYTAALSNGGTIISKEESERYRWLEEIEMPPESEMDVIEYLGPQIIDTSS